MMSFSSVDVQCNWDEVPRYEEHKISGYRARTFSQAGFARTKEVWSGDYSFKI